MNTEARKELPSVIMSDFIDKNLLRRQVGLKQWPVSHSSG